MDCSEALNPDSLKALMAIREPPLAAAKPEKHFRFERPDASKQKRDARPALLISILPWLDEWNPGDGTALMLQARSQPGIGMRANKATRSV